MSNKTSDKNVGSIEEDIRILQEKDCMWHYPETRIEEAIEDIIADYTRQKEMNEEHQKINGELRERIQKLEEKLLDMINGTEIINKETPEYIKENYIPKQVVIDKIEKLKEVRKIALERKMMSSVESFEIAIGHLEELLEGGK